MRTTFPGRFYVIVMLLLLLGAQESFAKRISVEEAKAKASAFWGKKINTPSKRKIYSVNASTKAYYVFNDEKDGFVIISGDDAVSTPVLGYSFTGHFDADAIPEGLRELLNDYERQISAMSADDYSATTSKVKSSFVGEKKIETAKWNQDSPYNKYCPAGCPTGCVATATAIVMRHYSWPNQGRGSNSYVLSSTGETLSADFSKSYYEWDRMPTGNTGDSYEGVARLMSDIGIAVEMQYSRNASSASMSSARQALVEHFIYSPKARILRADNFDPEEWKEKLRTEIDNNRLIMYDGQSIEGGHAFVVDGYKDDLFSINWGWGGWYDGYFSLGNLQPSEQDFAYNSDQSALVNIMPSDGTENVFSRLVLKQDDYGYCGFVSNATDVKSGQSFSLQTGQVLNSGKKNFDGELCVALFDESGIQKDIIFTFPIEDLPLNYYYYSLSFTCQSSVDAVEGDYIALVSKMADSEDYLLVGDEDMNVFKIPATNHIPQTANVSFEHETGISIFSNFGNNCMYESKPVIGSDFYFLVGAPTDFVKVMVRRHNGCDEILETSEYISNCYIIRVLEEDVAIVIHAYNELTSSANLQGYKTFYDAENNYQVDDENTTIYKVTATDNSFVTLTKVEGNVIPRGTPVILKTTDVVDYKLTLVLTSEEATGDWSDNLLQISDGTVTGQYVLAYTTAGGLGFYKNEFELAAGGVYVKAPASAKGRLSIGTDTDGTTSIMEMESSDVQQENVYNVAGQKVDAAYKGIVIKNGKKYLNK